LPQCSQPSTPNRRKAGQARPRLVHEEGVVQHLVIAVNLAHLGLHLLLPRALHLLRLLPLEDGIADALFKFTRPLTGAYFWCPPVKGKKLDLSALRI
jgi:hypothetical protein